MGMVLRLNSMGESVTEIKHRNIDRGECRNAVPETNMDLSERLCQVRKLVIPPIWEGQAVGVQECILISPKLGRCKSVTDCLKMFMRGTPNGCLITFDPYPYLLAP